MTVHVKALTYEPKIARVLNGKIRQTIRPLSKKKPVMPGDTLLLHGWFGKPYRSPWSWRINLRVVYVETLVWSGDWFFSSKTQDIGKNIFVIRLNPLHVKDILLKDGFKNPNDGIAFFRKNYPRKQLLQIIKWDWPPLTED